MMSKLHADRQGHTVEDMRVAFIPSHDDLARLRASLKSYFTHIFQKYDRGVNKLNELGNPSPSTINKFKVKVKVDGSRAKRLRMV